MEIYIKNINTQSSCCCRPFQCQVGIPTSQCIVRNEPIEQMFGENDTLNRSERCPLVDIPDCSGMIHMSSVVKTLEQVCRRAKQNRNFEEWNACSVALNMLLAIQSTATKCRLDQDAARKSDWISVDMRLPSDQENVLCWVNNRATIGYYIDTEVGWHDDHCYKIEPSHWMPLPKPPKEET